jgi:crossover junction endodeoxyribonuclease RuvC
VTAKEPGNGSRQKPGWCYLVGTGRGRLASDSLLRGQGNPSGHGMTTLRIIGIDPGLRRTGWGVIDTDGVRLGYVACGSVMSDAGGSLGYRLRQLFDGLSEVLAELAPVEAAIEQTFVNRDAGATLKLGQARGIAMLVPALQGIVIAEYAPNAVKKTVVGAGHGDKDQIRAMVKCLLPRAMPDSADAADALAIAITHAHARSWTRREAHVAVRAVP